MSVRFEMSVATSVAVPDTLPPVVEESVGMGKLGLRASTAMMTGGGRCEGGFKRTTVAVFLFPFWILIPYSLSLFQPKKIIVWTLATRRRRRL